MFLEDYVVDPRDPAACDPWTALAGIATATSRVRLGPLVTPLARRRPWKVAREVTTLDWLSSGRAVLGVGTGDWRDTSWPRFGEEADPRRRGELLDRALSAISSYGRVSSNRVRFSGRGYRSGSAVYGRDVALWSARRAGTARSSGGSRQEARRRC